MSENRLFLSGEENKYSSAIARGRAIASIVKTLEQSFFYIISYFGLIHKYQCVQFDSVLLPSA